MTAPNISALDTAVPAVSAGAIDVFARTLRECGHGHSYLVQVDPPEPTYTLYTTELGAECIRERTVGWVRAQERDDPYVPPVPKTFTADRKGKCIICTLTTEVGQELTWIDNPFKKGTTIPVHIDCRVKQLAAAYNGGRTPKMDDAP